MNFISNIFTKRLISKVPCTFLRCEHSLESQHKVNNLEKRFLVWTGKYKNVVEVPPFVSQSTMERCRNRVRIKVANYMMVVTAIGCIAMIYLGKQDAKKGVSLPQQNRDWHAEYNAKQSQNDTK